jgi:hypothetical protein
MSERERDKDEGFGSGEDPEGAQPGFHEPKGP